MSKGIQSGYLVAIHGRVDDGVESYSDGLGFKLEIVVKYDISIRGSKINEWMDGWFM